MDFTNQLKTAREKANVPISQFRNVSDGVKKYAERFNESARYFNVVELITPVNVLEEKERFLNCSDIEQYKVGPAFKYDENKLSMAVEAGKRAQQLSEDASEKIRGGSLSDDELFYLQLLLCRMESAQLVSRVAQGILEKNDEWVSRVLGIIYGLPDEAWAQRAVAEYDRIKRKEPATPSGLPDTVRLITPDELAYLQETKFNAQQIADAFRWVSRYYRFEMGWGFPLSPTATACDVRSASYDYNGPSMVTPDKRECDGLKLLELLGHECESHMRQEENGNSLFPGLGHAMMKADETHLEGIAKISDITFGELYEGKIIAAPLPWYILAIRSVMESPDGATFAETARRMYVLLREAGKTHKQAMTTAWTSTYRVKRGNTQDNPHFVQAKDAGYFMGYHIACDVVEAGLGQYLEMGCFSSKEILMIASRYLVEQGDIPFPREDATRAYLERVLLPKMRGGV